MTGKLAIRFHVWKKISLPNGDDIALVSSYADGSYLSIHDSNHNVFRLTPEGKVVWQVKRDDSIRGPGWWDILHHHARLEGLDGAREPFTYLWVVHADGYIDRDPSSRMPKDVQTWVPNCTIYLDGSAYQSYTLDPETGIATNITEGRVRPW